MDCSWRHSTRPTHCLMAEIRCHAFAVRPCAGSYSSYHGQESIFKADRLGYGPASWTEKRPVL
eukprot:scaffold103162_cov48-Attheya_sp.AAC.2